MNRTPRDPAVSRRTALAGLGLGALAVAAAARPAALSGGGLGLATFPTGMLARQATPASSPEEDLVRETERRRLRALVDFDMEVAGPLHADDFQLINPLGGFLSKDEYLGALASGAIDYIVFDPLPLIAVKMYDGVAVIRYQSLIEIVVDGEAFPAGAHLHTDLYEKRDGQWQVVWSQATAIQ